VPIRQYGEVTGEPVGWASWPNHTAESALPCSFSGVKGPYDHRIGRPGRLWLAESAVHLSCRFYPKKGLKNWPNWTYGPLTCSLLPSCLSSLVLLAVTWWPALSSCVLLLFFSINLRLISDCDFKRSGTLVCDVQVTAERLQSSSPSLGWQASSAVRNLDWPRR
jgi:hypothetical protein